MAAVLRLWSRSLRPSKELLRPQSDEDSTRRPLCEVGPWAIIERLALLGACAVSRYEEKWDRVIVNSVPQGAGLQCLQWSVGKAQSPSTNGWGISMAIATFNTVND
jgi:hypothetical protein